MQDEREMVYIKKYVYVLYAYISVFYTYMYILYNICIKIRFIKLDQSKVFDKFSGNPLNRGTR